MLSIRLPVQIQGEWQHRVGPQGRTYRPRGLALTPDEAFLLVACTVDTYRGYKPSGRVAVLRASDGMWVKDLMGPPSTLLAPFGVAVVPSTGEIIVSDEACHRVLRFRSCDDDTVVGTLGTGLGSGPTQLSWPRGLVVLAVVFICIVSKRPSLFFVAVITGFIVSTCHLMNPSGGPRGRGGRLQQPSIGPVAPG